MQAFICMTPNSRWRLPAPLRSIPQDVARSLGAKQTVFSLKCLSGDIEDTPHHKKTNKLFQA